ncbi:probable L-ascorbate peroxidase 3, peroxisomal [Elaeis guineensis]|uniref:probable L-ascorbate peroxidase 3, peroxisomal n=1 Tax=Elaeis guineensis var. tenera TaxID=51953 RepID=UPI003C6D3D4B
MNKEHQKISGTVRNFLISYMFLLYFNKEGLQYCYNANYHTLNQYYTQPTALTRTAVYEIVHLYSFDNLMSNMSFFFFFLSFNRWHDAGTYDKKTKTGGPNGSIRIEEEYSHGSNAGLKIAVDLLEPVKAKHPKITYADLYQLAGVVAVEVRGGPTIDFVPERKFMTTYMGQCNVGVSHLREVFYWMTLLDKDIIALSGGHTLIKY